MSGLETASAEISVIGDNIANANTTGFKERRAEFSAVLGQNITVGSGFAQFGSGALSGGTPTQSIDFNINPVGGATTLQPITITLETIGGAVGVDRKTQFSVIPIRRIARARTGSGQARLSRSISTPTDS